MSRRFVILGSIALLCGFIFGYQWHKARALPPDFQVTQIVGSGLSGPSGFDIAPDGRIFILERSGAVKIYKAGRLLGDPFTVLPSAATGDRGLIGVAFDPYFSQNHFVYFYYTDSRDLLNYLVRFDASSDRAEETPVTIYQTSTPSQFLHSGGTVAFGSDGKIYLAIGDNGYPPNAQDLSNAHGKILRLNVDGTIPNDNPFYGQAGKLPEIWAYGFRNPWRFQFDALTGKLIAGDVGESQFEEINEVRRGENYGWPICEGFCSQFTQPLHAYAHSGASSAITAGPIYQGDMFPESYKGSFFFSDYGQGFIKRALFDNAGSISHIEDFSPTAGSVVDMHTAPDGSLYYLTYFPGRLYRIDYSTGNHIPVAAASSNLTRGLDPLTVHFTSSGSFDPDGDTLSYLWDFGDGTTSTEADPTKVFTVKGTYIVELTVSDGTTSSLAVPIVVQVGQVPTVSIGTPVEGALYKAGDEILFSAHGVDGAGIDLPDANFTTEVRFHHHDHIHPFLGPAQIKNGSFVIPTTGEPDPDTWYEIRVTGSDTNGLSGVAAVNIYPRKSHITIVTDPPGLDVNLDGTPLHTPVNVLGVVGFERFLEAPNQGNNNTYYVFDSWSDGGEKNHKIAFPENDITLTARFNIGTGACDVVGNGVFIGCYHANKTLSDLRVIRTDEHINFNWGGGAAGQGLPVDDFSVRWSGDFAFSPGVYEFSTATDDGLRLYIDGQLVQDHWTEQSAAPHTSTLSLSGGTHRIIMEYFEAGGDASAKLSWVKTGELPSQVNCHHAPLNTFNSCFFYQRDLTDFKVQRTDAYPLVFDWGLESPDPAVSADNFSASFIGTFNFEDAPYTFTVSGDDGVRLFVDDIIILDKWVDQPPTQYEVRRAMGPGLHHIKLEYYENGGGAVAKLSWKKDQIEPAPSNCTGDVHGAFTACYFDNQDFTGTLVQRTESYPLSHEWFGGSPDPSMDSDSFSVRWKGSFAFDDGIYEFTVTGDDGVRLLIDGGVVLDKFIDQPPTTYRVQKEMHAGVYPVLLEYYEHGGDATAGLSWKRVGGLPAPSECGVGNEVFIGCYYDNKDFTSLALTRADAIVSFNFGPGAPDAGMGPEEYSIRWKGSYNFADGDYAFTTRADDGVRVYIDGILISDHWVNQSAATYSVVKPLSAGVHEVILEYYENWGDAEVSLTWALQ